MGTLSLIRKKDETRKNLIVNPIINTSTPSI